MCVFTCEFVKAFNGAIRTIASSTILEFTGFCSYIIAPKHSTDLGMCSTNLMHGIFKLLKGWTQGIVPNITLVFIWLSF